MPRDTHTDMAQVTLTMLQRLEDFENYILTAESKLREKPPESSRVQSQEVQLKNIRGSIGALKQSIRMYRELWWKEKSKNTG